MTILRRAGVIGHPISHSKSPKIHGYWLNYYGITGTYEAIDIEPSALEEGCKRLVEQGFSGWNVTLPHKQAILDLCTTLSPEAQQIGAVNTIRVDLGTGSLHGHNTDAFGFAANLEETYPHFDWAAGSALVLGAGGAARAVIAALLQKGVPHILLSNRTIERAKELQNMGSEIDIVDWGVWAKYLPQVHLLINATSLGMVGQPPLEADLSGLQSHTTVYDIVYNPLMTPFLQAAVSRSCPIVTGIGMLLHQARPGFAAWFGTEPQVTDELRNLLLGL